MSIAQNVTKNAYDSKPLMLPFQTDAAQRKDGAHKCAKIQATERFACDFTEIPFHVDLF